MATIMQVGRRGRILKAIKGRLENIRQGERIPIPAWSSDPEANYPFTMESVHLSPVELDVLERNSQLPAAIVQYYGGSRDYYSKDYANLNQVEEMMQVLIRVSFNKIGTEEMSVIAAELHGSVDACLNIAGGLEEGVKVIKLLEWDVPIELQTQKRMTVDFIYEVVHVFSWGGGV